MAAGGVIQVMPLERDMTEVSDAPGMYPWGFGYGFW